MSRLEDLARGATVKGILPDSPVTIVDVRWIGSNVIELTYKDAAGRPYNEFVYRDREPTLEVVAAGTPWSFDGDGAHEPRYIHRPFQREPDFGVTSVNYDLDELLDRSEGPT